MLEARPAAMAPRVNGFRDANGRLSMNAHQWLGICAYASLVLGFYLLQAPALEDSTTRLALEICYGAIALVAACAFVKAAAVDPDDDDDDEAGLFCQLCDRNVHAGASTAARATSASRTLTTTASGSTMRRREELPQLLRPRRLVLWQCGQLCAGAWLLAWVSRNPRGGRPARRRRPDSHHMTRLEFQAALARTFLSSASATSSGTSSPSTCCSSDEA